MEDGDSYLHMMRGRYLNNGISKEEYIHIYKMLKGTLGCRTRIMRLSVRIWILRQRLKGHSDYDGKRYVLSSELEKLCGGIYGRYISDAGGKSGIHFASSKDGQLTAAAPYFVSA